MQHQQWKALASTLGVLVTLGLALVLLVGSADAGPPGTPTVVTTATDLRFWDVTPDGTTVVFQDGEQASTVPLAGGAVTALTPALPAGATMRGAVMTPDGTSLLYWIDDDNAGEVSLQRIPIVGGSAIELLNRSDWTTPPTVHQVMSPNGAWLAYIPTEGTDAGQMHSTPIAGGATEVLSAIGARTDFGVPTISPDSARVLFVSADFRFFTAPLDGSAAEIQVSSSIGQHADVALGLFSPDSATVVYSAFATAGFNAPRELFSAPAMGGSVQQLTTGGGPNTGITDPPTIDATSTTVIYTYSTDGSWEDLYSVPLAGGTPVQLSDPRTANGSIGVVGVAGSTVIYTGPQAPAGRRELYRVPITGGTPVRLNDPITNGSVEAASLNPTGTHVLYYHQEQVHLVPVFGGAPAQVGGPQGTGEFLPILGSTAWSPDGSRFVLGREYSDDDEPDQNFWSGTSDGATLVRLDQVSNTTLGPAHVTPGARVVFQRTPTGAAATELRMVDLSTITAPPATPSPTATAAPTAVPVATPTSTPGPLPTPSPTPHPLGCTIFGTSGDDTLIGTSGPDVICGFAGDDLIRGKGGDDILIGGSGSDRLIGGRGADRLKGGPGRDRLSGGKGSDWLDGGKGRDKLFGRSGADTLLGRRGADLLKGGPGRDKLRGGPGADILDGGPGRDDIAGGPGIDRIVAR